MAASADLAAASAESLAEGCMGGAMVVAKEEGWVVRAALRM
jgi:hypothetical protein